MKAYNTLIAGSAGGGKTSKAREYHDIAEGCSLFMTSKESEANVAGKPVAGRRALNSAVSEASSMTDVRVKWIGADYDADIETAREWARDVWHYRGWPVQIIVDEAQNSGLANNEGPIKTGLHEDRDHGIKWVPMTQDPQDLETGYPALKQCEWFVWCGPVKTFHKGFLSYYNLRELEFPQKRYRTVTILPTLPPRIIYRGQTRQKYA